jgi:hypothetical protein
MVAGECALKSAISNMKGTWRAVGSLGEKEGGQPALRFIFVRVWVGKRRRRDGTRSGGGTAWCPKEGENPEWAALGQSGPHRPGTQAGTDKLERNYFSNLKPDFKFKNQNIQIFLNLI